MEPCNPTSSWGSASSFRTYSEPFQYPIVTSFNIPMPETTAAARISWLRAKSPSAVNRSSPSSSRSIQRLPSATACTARPTRRARYGCFASPRAKCNGRTRNAIRNMGPTVPPALGRTPESAAEIVSRLAGDRPALVALSGGVDSAVVACLAYRARGAHAIAVTLTSPAVSSEEFESAARVARAIGIRHVRLTSDPLSDARYAENPTNRCYFCRNHEGGLLRAWGKDHEVELYLDGIHLDDLGDDRPGLQAMNEHGFRHPLAEAGWHKTDVRSLARSAGLPSWDRPSNACLASRIPHGQRITVPRSEEHTS